MSKLHSTINSCLGIILLGGVLSTTSTIPATAQSIIPANDGTGTRVNTQGNLVDITGGSFSRDGANLFHSFQQLNVPTGTTANFIASPNIQNILGRVVGGNPSLINGLIQVTGSNSNLYIINPAGIVFGNNASLNVPAAFTATTANQIGFGNNNWLTSFGTNNYQNLTGTPNQFLFNTPLAGSIANTGNLILTPGQNLTLLGGAVFNTGTLSSPGGNITVMAVPGTNLVRLSQLGHLLSLEVVPPENGIITPLSLPQLLTGNSNITGVTLSPDGTLPLAGFDVPLDRGNAVIAGRINTVNRNVNLPLVPRVQVLGDRIALFNTVINASSVFGGGTVLIGGEYLGQGIIPTAQFTFADTNTRIRANGIGNANGGRVIAWANNTTRFFGAINARGGNLGGNGGFIETSGKLSLDVSGIRINANSPFGSPGLWLLDPINITISGTATAGGTYGGGLFVSDNIAPTANILASDIISTLNAGTDVILTTNQGPIGGNGDININTNLNINPPISGVNFVLSATRNININAPINSTGGLLNINLLAPTAGNINISSAINTRGGNFTAALGGTFTSSGSIATGGGNFTVNANNSFIATNSISTLSNTGNSGNINIRATNGSIATQDLRSSNTLIGGVAGSVTLNAPLGISVGTINSSRTGALLGTGSSINITTNGLFRANNSLLTPPICAGASLCSYGNISSGKITIQHGGGLTNLFVVGGATNNGTLGGIYSSGLLSSVTVPVPPAENSYFAGNTTIITSVPPPPIPVAPLPLEIFSLLRNPEAPPTPPPVVVGTPPTIEPVPDPVPEPQAIPAPSPIPILSPSPNPSPTTFPTPVLEVFPLPILLPSPTLTTEQFSQFARDFQDRRSPLPLPEIIRPLDANTLCTQLNQLFSQDQDFENFLCSEFIRR